MWENLGKEHQKAMISLLCAGPKDLILVSECGGRVGTHRLLLALHSPLVADLLLLQDVDGEKTAISLPFPLSSVVALTNALKERQGGGRRKEVKELAGFLGIHLKPEESVKMELVSDEAEMENDFLDRESGELVKFEEEEEKKPFNKTKFYTKTKRSPNIKTDYDNGSTDESSDEDDNDPDFVTPTTTPVKSSKNQNLSEGSQKRGRGRPRKKPLEEIPCDHCDRHFKTNKLLLKHRLEKHNISIKCDSCDNKYLAWEDYKKHLREEHPGHTCDICGEKKFTSTALSIHIESKHQDDLPCPQCGLMFATKTSLNHHIGKNHGEYEIIQCEKCEFTTRVASIMRTHFKRKHMADDMKKTCEVCGETFKELHLHLSRTACGKSEKTFHCDQCDKAFFTRPSLKQHTKRVHDTIRVKDKFCSQCSYSTYSNYNLKLHVTSVHQGNILVKQACPHCDKVSKSLSYHISVYHPEKLDFHANAQEQNKDIIPQLSQP